MMGLGLVGAAGIGLALFVVLRLETSWARRFCYVALFVFMVLIGAVGQ